MKYLTAFDLLSKEEASFSFNFNFLETNVINLALLLALLLYATSTTFNVTLEKRKVEIIQALSFAQDDFLKSLEYYKISISNLENNLLYLQALRSFNSNDKKQEILAKYKKTKQKIVDNFIATENLLLNLENKAFLLIQRYIILRISSKILRKFFGLSKKEQNKFFEQTLLELGAIEL